MKYLLTLIIQYCSRVINKSMGELSFNSNHFQNIPKRRLSINKY